MLVSMCCISLTAFEFFKSFPIDLVDLRVVLKAFSLYPWAVVENALFLNAFIGVDSLLSVIRSLW